jgi:hypothetical protein
MPRFVQAIVEGAQFAKGSRFLPEGGSDDITTARRLGNYGLCAVVNTLFGTRFTDLCYGYIAFDASFLEALDIDCPGFEVETFMNIRAAKLDLRVAEVPSFEAVRIHGESNLHPVRDGLRVLRTIARERLTHSRRTPAEQPVSTRTATRTGAGRSAPMAEPQAALAFEPGGEVTGAI